LQHCAAFAAAKERFQGKKRTHIRPWGQSKGHRTLTLAQMRSVRLRTKNIEGLHQIKSCIGEHQAKTVVIIWLQQMKAMLAFWG
jgi:hypothetical protein